jgi:DNA-binding MarR family transcriptional regulator
MNTPKHIVDLHTIDELGPTFVGLQLLQLSDIIDFQGNELFLERGITIPSRATSTLVFVHRKGPTTVTELAKYLCMSHQLAGLRIRDLKAHGLVREYTDPADSRRSLIELTPQGKRLSRQVEKLCGEIREAFLDLFAEIENDLFDTLIQAKQALAATGLPARVAKQQRNAG